MNNPVGWFEIYVQDMERAKAFYEAVPQRDKTRAQVEYSCAEKAFQQAIRKKPDRVEAYLYLGRTYFVQKKYLRFLILYVFSIFYHPAPGNQT